MSCQWTATGISHVGNIPSIEFESACGFTPELTDIYNTNSPKAVISDHSYTFCPHCGGEIDDDIIDIIE